MLLAPLYRTADSTRVRSWIDRFDQSLGWYIALVVFVSLIPLGLVYILCAAAGTLWEHGFNPFDIFSGGHPLEHKNQVAIPLLSDLPSILLSFASTSSIITYFILHRLRFSLERDLLKSGLLHPADSSQVMDEFGHLLRRGRKRVALDWFTVAFVLVISISFYLSVKNNSYLFRTVSRLTNARMTPEQIRISWWASHNWVLGSAWIGLGFVGTLLAIFQGWDYLRIVSLCDRLRSARVLDHVPTWEGDQYGWRPVTRLVDLKAVGAFTFVIAYLPVFYLLHGSSTYLDIALVVLLLIATGLTLYQLRILIKIPSMHREIVRSKIDALSKLLSPMLEQVASNTLPIEEYPRLTAYLLRADQLNRAMNLRMYKYIRAAQFLGPVFLVLGFVSAIVTISGI